MRVALALPGDGPRGRRPGAGAARAAADRDPFADRPDHAVHDGAARRFSTRLRRAARSRAAAGTAARTCRRRLPSSSALIELRRAAGDWSSSSCASPAQTATFRPARAGRRCCDGRRRRYARSAPRTLDAGRPRRADRRDDRQRHRDAGAGGTLDLDDVSFSTVRQPDTAIVRRDALRRWRARTFTFRQRRGSDVPLRARRRPRSAVREPVHARRARAAARTRSSRDRGRRLRRAPTDAGDGVTFTVAAPPPSPTPTATAVPDATDNCPAAANSRPGRRRRRRRRQRLRACSRPATSRRSRA